MGTHLNENCSVVTEANLVQFIDLLILTELIELRDAGRGENQRAICRHGINPIRNNQESKVQ